MVRDVYNDAVAAIDALYRGKRPDNAGLAGLGVVCSYATLVLWSVMLIFQRLIPNPIEWIVAGIGIGLGITALAALGVVIVDELREE